MEIAPNNLKSAEISFWFFRLRKFILLVLIVFLSYWGLISLNSGGFPLAILILLLPFNLFRQMFLNSSSFNSLTLREILFVRKKSKSIGFDILIGIIVYSIVYLPSWELFEDESLFRYGLDNVPAANFFHKSYGILVTALIILFDHFIVRDQIQKITKRIFFRTESFILKGGGFINKQRDFDRDWVFQWSHTVDLDEYLSFLEEKCENDSWWPENDFFDPPKEWVGFS